MARECRALDTDDRVGIDVRPQQRSSHAGNTLNFSMRLKVLDVGDRAGDRCGYRT